MIYLDKFIFPDLEHDTLEDKDAVEIRESFYSEHTYPFHLTSGMGLWSLDFEPVTLLYGGNGSGKSTIINVIGEKLRARRHSIFNSSPFFKKYVERCEVKVVKNMVGESLSSGKKGKQKYDISDYTTVLTSDDIFHWMQELRLENDKKIQKSYYLQQEYKSPKKLPTHLNFETGHNVDEYREGAELRRARSGRNYSFNKYLIDNLGKLERCFSNGETALMKLSELINKPGLYLLDEPENSMSCEFQRKLASIIEYMSRYGKCQFLIATHSPFLLSMENAKIYNLDHYPVNLCDWWELENMGYYFDLFYGAREHFLNGE